MGLNTRWGSDEKLERRRNTAGVLEADQFGYKEMKGYDEERVFMESQKSFRKPD